MQLPALAIRQPDLGRTLAQAATIKGQALKNRLMEAQIGREGQVSELSRQAMGVDPTYNALAAGGGPTPEAAAALETGMAPSAPSSDAMKRLAAEDPKRAKALTDVLGNLDENQRKKLDYQNKLMGQALVGVLNAPPEQQAMAYAQWRAQLQQRGVSLEGIPEQWQGARWGQMQLMSVTAIDDTLKMQQPRSPIGKLASDLAKGIISPEEYRAGVDIAKKPLVQMDTRQETERAKKYGGKMGAFYAERFVDAQKGADAARRSNARLDRLDQLLDQTFTGTFAGTLVDVQNAARTLGIDLSALPGNIAPAEAAKALANEMALELRNPAGGAGMPGAMSDKDREFLISMVPGLGQTPEGRKLLIATRKKVNQRSIDVARIAREYEKKHGKIDAGFDTALQQHADANPMFTKEDMNLREKSRLPAVTNEAEYTAVPSGTYYTDPNGQTRQKP